uniref:Small glutamine-rich tetratricopeptide repeat-containing protein beta n=1 Tax=Coturnix japonica TaxID=93934 RepID=A0A8C2TGH3_COTJA
MGREGEEGAREAGPRGEAEKGEGPAEKEEGPASLRCHRRPAAGRGHSRRDRAAAAAWRIRFRRLVRPVSGSSRRPARQEKFISLKMSSVKRLVYAFIHFLREQSQMETFTPDEQESLEVAIQCLETVFKVNLEDTHLAPPQHLIEIFANSFHKNDKLPLSDSLPEDIEKADHLKDEGNNHMKEENYGAAVDCYTRAIELDPNNAVYYCNRAAAQSKLSKYSEAIKDCERAIAIDPKYSKAYGRMGLALTSVNKYEEAITSYQKALDLDPENDSYKSNLKVAEQKLRDMSSPTGTGLSFDMASLINNPAFISMVSALQALHCIAFNAEILRTSLV